MDVMEALRTRRSIRKYRKEPVKQEILEEILDIARWSPSAGHSQPWEFITVTDSKTKNKLSKSFMFGSFLDEAAAGILVMADTQRTSCPLQDGTLAAYSIMLAAHGLGLGTCWINPSFFEAEVKAVLGIPREMQLICMLSIGYPDEKPEKPRLPLERMLHRETYGNK